MSAILNHHTYCPVITPKSAWNYPQIQHLLSSVDAKRLIKCQSAALLSDSYTIKVDICIFVAISLATTKTRPFSLTSQTHTEILAGVNSFIPTPRPQILRADWLALCASAPDSLLQTRSLPVRCGRNSHAQAKTAIHYRAKSAIHFGAKYVAIATALAV